VFTVTILARAPTCTSEPEPIPHGVQLCIRVCIRCGAGAWSLCGTITVACTAAPLGGHSPPQCPLGPGAESLYERDSRARGARRSSLQPEPQLARRKYGRKKDRIGTAPDLCYRSCTYQHGLYHIAYIRTVRSICIRATSLFFDLSKCLGSVVSAGSRSQYARGWKAACVPRPRPPSSQG
jgi:hypothetical protein